MAISRRDTLKGILSIAGSLGIAPCDAFARLKENKANGTAKRSGSEGKSESSAGSPIRSSEEIYRKEFAATFGEVANHGHAFHCVNCQGNCAWQVWSFDGKVTRENQSASYPAISPTIPDFNPRGCNKGVQHSQTMYSDDRLLYPMKRVGKRGEGKWKRVSWAAAIDEVAQNLYQTLIEKGPSGNYVHIGAGVLSETRAASIKRLGALLGAVRPYIASYVGDMFPGVSVVYGEGNIGCSYDFIYKTNAAIFWGCNPNTSRIPDAHFLWEAKYNGSKIVVISPEYNSTAIHADLWVPIKPGYDGHLAMSIMHDIVKRKLYNVSFLQEYTDLALLVRSDNQRFLRLSDVDPTQINSPSFDSESYRQFVKPSNVKENLKEGEEPRLEELFFVWNRKNRKISLVPGSSGSPVDTLRLKDRGWDLDPALEGSWEVEIRAGVKVRVTPVFELFKKRLASYSPDKMQPLTGVSPKMVSELSDDLIKSQVALITLGFAVGKYFNGLFSQRAIAGLCALVGRLGPRGGLNTENEWNITGLQKLSAVDGKSHRFASGFVSEFVLGNEDTKLTAFTEDDVKTATGFSKEELIAKVKEQLAVSKGDEGFSKGKPNWPESETFLLFADARFRRNKGPYRSSFLKKAKFIAYGDYRMSDFATFADVLLPCKSHYEVWDLRANPGYHRFVNFAHPPANLKSIGETKSEWEIATLLVERIEQIAKAKFRESKESRFLKVADKTHTQAGFRSLEQLVKEFTLDGRLRTDQDAVHLALEQVDQFKPNSVAELKNRGGFLVLNEKAGKSSPLYPDVPYNTFENNLFLHERFETLTGRLSFYIDHPLWISMKAELPGAMPPLRSQKYSFLLMTPHARWSIHSTYKTSPLLLRLQRGMPYIMIHPALARERKIQDGDRVELFNELARVQMMAKIVSTVPKTALVMEHGWEPFMYPNGVGHNELMEDLPDLLELSDGWGHLKFGVNWDGNQHAYLTTVDIKRI